MNGDFCACTNTKCIIRKQCYRYMMVRAERQVVARFESTFEGGILSCPSFDKTQANDILRENPE